MIDPLPCVISAICAKVAKENDIPVDNLRALAATGFRDTSSAVERVNEIDYDQIDHEKLTNDLTRCYEELQLLTEMFDSKDRDGVEMWLQSASDKRMKILDYELQQYP